MVVDLARRHVHLMLVHILRGGLCVLRSPKLCLTTRTGRCSSGRARRAKVEHLHSHSPRRRREAVGRHQREARPSSNTSRQWWVTAHETERGHHLPCPPPGRCCPRRTQGLPSLWEASLSAIGLWALVCAACASKPLLHPPPAPDGSRPPGQRLTRCSSHPIPLGVLGYAPPLCE